MTTDLFNRALEHVQEYAKEYVFHMHISQQYGKASVQFSKAHAVIQLFTGDQFWELLTLFNNTIEQERKEKNV